MGMEGLDAWITGHYGEDQYDDCYCPECGANVDVHGYTEVEGHFASGVYVFKCDTCGAIVQEGYWLNQSESRAKFYG